MDGFTYTDIFDTKGLEYLIIIAFLILVIPFWKLLNKPVKMKKPAEDYGKILSIADIKIPQGLFFHKNHTWSHMERAGLIRIGLDDLINRLTGSSSLVLLKNEGDTINRGDIIARIEQNGKQLKILSPVSGDIQKINSAYNEYSDSMDNEIYGEKWLLKIKPSKWREETSSAFLAENATEWFKQELEKTKEFFTGSMQEVSDESGMRVLQEGGELMGGSLSGMPDGVWNSFQKKFLDKL
jgi:glycine cleavage system H protein